MKIIILEGIATSGKTSTCSILQNCFEKYDISFKIIREDETLMPLLNSTNLEIAEKHILDIIEKYTSHKFDFLVFDRLYFTHMFRTNSTLESFEEVELKLSQFDTEILFFKIDEDFILPRIKQAFKNRESKWIEYVKQKGELKQITQYYTKQQQLLLQLLDDSSIDHSILNTTQFDMKLLEKNLLKILELEQ